MIKNNPKSLKQVERHFPFLGSWRNILRTLVLPRLIYKFNTIPTKIPTNWGKQFGTKVPMEKYTWN